MLEEDDVAIVSQNGLIYKFAKIQSPYPHSVLCQPNIQLEETYSFTAKYTASNLKRPTIGLARKSIISSKTKEPIFWKY